MKLGIDKLGFYTPPAYLDMLDLAEERDVDPNKYIIGIGQEKMSIAPKAYDIVAMAANAANRILTDSDKEAIDMVLFATESSVDFSRSAGTWVHELIGLQPNTRSVELKQACYSATAGIQLAMGHLALRPSSKVLVLASDIAKYGIKTGGEPTQGAGAVAMLLSTNPSILAVEPESGYFTKATDDFWRPTYAEFPYVDGKYSNEAYLDTLMATWNHYKETHKGSLSEFEALTFHVPYTKMGRKALQALADEMDEETAERFDKHYESAILYNKNVGNIYTGSLYLNLISLLEQAEGLEVGDRIGMYSYGSGSVGEFFAGQLQEGFEKHLMKEENEALLENRVKLTIEEYEEILERPVFGEEDGNMKTDDSYTNKGDFIFSGLDDHRRRYVIAE